MGEKERKENNLWLPEHHTTQWQQVVVEVVLLKVL